MIYFFWYVEIVLSLGDSLCERPGHPRESLGQRQRIQVLYMQNLRKSKGGQQTLSFNPENRWAQLMHQNRFYIVGLKPKNFMS